MWVKVKYRMCNHLLFVCNSVCICMSHSSLYFFPLTMASFDFIKNNSEMIPRIKSEEKRKSKEKSKNQVKVNVNFEKTVVR